MDPDIHVSTRNEKDLESLHKDGYPYKVILKNEDNILDIVP